LALCLGIESSCDETAAAVVADGRVIRSSVIASQADLHRVYGGVVPEVASRRHIELILPVVDRALSEASTKIDEVDCIAATYGPGLVGSLLVGLMFAKGLAFAKEIPFVGVNHIEGHVYANFLEHPDLEPPAVCLTVSGGHTEILEIKDFGEYVRLGMTRDDAAGECLDKVGRVLGLEYPAGPQIDRLAVNGDPDRYPLPRSMMDEETLDVSFSGLKTAALNLINSERQRGREVDVGDFSASLLEAVVDTLVDRCRRALLQTGAKRLMLSGGVAANRRLREKATELGESMGVSVYYPSLKLCTDNAAMIASAGAFRFMRGQTSSLALNASPGLRL